MSNGNVYMYYGTGKGKTALAIGKGIHKASLGQSVIMVRFLGGIDKKDSFECFEPEFRVFTFSKKRDRSEFYNCQKEEVINEIVPALNFSKKVLETDGCELLILDGVLDAVELGCIDEESLFNILEKRNKNVDIILTGETKNENMFNYCDYVFNLSVEKENK